MARDYNDLYDLNNLSDDEIKDLVLQQLHEYPDIDPDLVELNVENGAVRVSGRVGTEQELQTIEQVLTDVIGIRTVNNELVIDEVVRGERSAGADDAYVEDREADAQLGGGAVSNNTSDTAQHLVDDLDADQFGTHNPQEAIERGTAYEPPDRGIQQGTYSRENH